MDLLASNPPQQKCECRHGSPGLYFVYFSLLILREEEVATRQISAPELFYQANSTVSSV